MEQTTSLADDPAARARQLRDTVVREIAQYVRAFGSDRASVEEAYWALQPAWDALFSVYACVEADNKLACAVDALTRKDDEVKTACERTKDATELYYGLCKKNRNATEMNKLARMLNDAGQHVYNMAVVQARSNAIDGYNEDGSRRT